ncbi:MAG TPA: response regulator [Methanobacterium sp.]|nr:response regulator [Methanobacterium sp.]
MFRLNAAKILLVEDNPADARLVIEAFKYSKIETKIYVTEDGHEAMEFLKNKEKYAKSPKPDIILLDLNLPRKDGREVLKEIKGDENLKLIPVVILTTSIAKEDIINTYKNYANCYITKPVDLDQFISVVKSIQDFWLSKAELPGKI